RRDPGAVDPVLDRRRERRTGRGTGRRGAPRARPGPPARRRGRGRAGAGPLDRRGGGRRAAEAVPGRGRPGRGGRARPAGHPGAVGHGRGGARHRLTGRQECPAARGVGSGMALTRAHGPLSATAPATTNYRIDGPAHKLLMHPFPRRVRAEFAGRTVLDTRDGVLVHETNLLPRLYVPEQDIDQSLFVPSAHTTHCPFKGVATYRT